MSNELIVYCIGTFVHFISFFFLFEVFWCAKCKFVLVLRTFFFFKAQTSCRPNLEFQPVVIKMSRNTRNKLKWPEIFSKWNRNTLDKIPGVATVFRPLRHIYLIGYLSSTEIQLNRTALNAGMFRTYQLKKGRYKKRKNNISQ